MIPAAWRLEPTSTVAQGVKDQIEAAIDEADVIVFLVDVTQAVTRPDLEMAERLRRVSKPILLVANKADKSETGKRGRGVLSNWGWGNRCP